MHAQTDRCLHVHTCIQVVVAMRIASPTASTLFVCQSSELVLHFLAHNEIYMLV